MGKRAYLIFFLLLEVNSALFPQAGRQVVKGTVSDLESGKPIDGAGVFVIGSDPPAGTVTDAKGWFSIPVVYGRISLRISYVGYEDLVLTNILVSSGREVQITAGLRERTIKTGEVVVKGDNRLNNNLNPMAALSVHTLRPEDAMHYAGGFYDPSRMVNSFAGVVTSNNDYSNEIVIRGNSSRGLLWRLEGIEIPNPNHFSDARGGSGGAFSSITSNVIDNFDFFTGAFPAEFGNASSGVMDMNLRKGNSGHHEFAFQTGMIGAELAAEGPLTAGGSSYLVNARFTNFSILSNLGLIDLGETNLAPRTKDLLYNISFPAGKAGYLNFFGVYGSSQLGKTAERDVSLWNDLSDRWEEKETQGSAVAGVKNLLILPAAGTYIKTVAAFSYSRNAYNEGYIDSSFRRKDSYYYDYAFPSFRFSSVINHKVNAVNSLRGGLYYSLLSSRMENFRLLQNGFYDTLVLPSARGSIAQAFLQWKARKNNVELNTGFHILHFTVNGNTSFEPRLGLRWNLSNGTAITAGAGFHSRAESLSVYYANIKTESGYREPVNSGMDLSKAFHLAAGLDIPVNNDLRVKFELYYQKLFHVPVENKATSRYSAINSSEGLPEAILDNTGKGYNKGIEMTLVKEFTRDWYFLLTGSLFDSRYRAGDKNYYNTYYNTRYVYNVLSGKDFRVGREKRNVIGVNLKIMARGGYRYTPPDYARTYLQKRLVTDKNRTYAEQLPVFARLDAGLNFRVNKPGYSWIVMLDVQNATDRRNIFRKRFSWENGNVKVYNVTSLGIVPVFNFRVEF